MTQAENSAKNNRMSFNDVQELISDEKKGETVVSWHSKYLWDKIKLHIANDSNALRASKILRENLHNILILFSMIDQAGYAEYLERYLNLDYSYYDYKFTGFNPEDGTFKEVKKIRLDNENQKKNAERYLRIAFEELGKYRKKDNRKLGIVKTRELDLILKFIIENIRNNKLEDAHNQILNYIAKVGNMLLLKYGL